MEFQEWFIKYGNNLFNGYLRAIEDGNTEDFINWIVGEYEIYKQDRDTYEVPYHGLLDKRSKLETLIK